MTAPTVCVVLPVHRPDPGFLAAQLATLAVQGVPGMALVGVVADGQSGGLLRKLATGAGLDLTPVDPGTALEAPRAVEAGLSAALALAGPDTRFALCDQDDLWRPDRLARGLAALAGTGAALAHSDARLIDGGGAVLHISMFRYERRHPRPGLRGLLLRNSVTGMTATFTRALVDLALPIPAQAGVHFYHDLWLALLAEATAGIARIDEALVDYRQHGDNVMGAQDRRRPPRLRLALPDTAWLRREAAPYALARYLAHAVAARLDQGVADGRLARRPPQATALRPYLRAGGGTGRLMADAGRLAVTGHLRMARIAGGHAAVSLGRSVWALREALGPGLAAARAEFDTRLFTMAPGIPPPAPARPPASARAADTLIDTRKRPRFTPEFTAPAPGVRILVPTLNPTEVFAGVATAFDLGLGLAAGGLEVTLIATDLPVYSPDAARRFVTGRMTAAQAAAGAGGRMHLACGASGGRVAGHRGDRFLATAWWTAHLAHDLIGRHGYATREFLYLLQDYEPNFYPWGPEFADAGASLALPFTPVFNSLPLRDFYAAQGYGFATPDSLTFHPAIDLGLYAGPRPAPTGPRRLAVYGRPEVPRNMFATAIEALEGFARGIAPGEVEFLSVGLRHDPVKLGHGHVLRSLGKLPLADYPAWLRTVDVGLALMLSPHPSHPPLEMAAAGVRVVTNRFAGKDLGALSPAILSVDPNAGAVAAGLARAWALGPADDAARRIDLTALGAPLDEVTRRLAARLRAEGLTSV